MTRLKPLTLDFLIIVIYNVDIRKFYKFSLSLCDKCKSKSRNSKKVGLRFNKIIRKNMAKKLYVGGLSYDTTEDSLKEAFAKAGTVESAIIIIDKMSGRSKGFGFVEFSSDEEAQKAIEMWNGKEFEGRSLTVNEARPMEERPRRDFNRDGGSNNRW